MLNDEKVLLKTSKLLETLGFNIKNPQNLQLLDEKVLREVTEDELVVMQDILDDLKGDKLAFDKLFDGEMRKVIDFPTMDTSTELGKFGEFFKKQDLDVDWEKGLVSAERDVRTSDDLLNTLIGMDRGDPEKTKTKKIQMKIGKFFAKVADLSSKKKVLTDKVLDFAKNNRDKLPMKFGERSPTSAGEITGNMMQTVFSPEELKRYNQLFDQLSLYIPNPGYVPRDQVAWATKMAKYWQTNAGYIKKEINKLDNDKYSIIITRHPIDVMRMSDFDKITSCHTPPSRGGQTRYYKCAVAEARGHGAIAYVVETEYLLYMTNTSNIESAEQEIQEGEIFHDDHRFDTYAGMLHPLSRVRLRQMRYYKTDNPKRWDEGPELAVPEKRVYGAGIPGLVDRVIKWARENQEEVIKNMPADKEGNYNLDDFMIFGGSYEDTQGVVGREELIAQLTGYPDSMFVGSVKQNKETEEQLDANLLGDVSGAWRQECQRIVDEWNQRYAATKVEFEVEDDGDGGYYIQGSATMVIDWDSDEWEKLPNSYPTAGYAAGDLNDMWGDIFISDDAFINKKSDGTIRWGCRIDARNPTIAPNADGGDIFYDPDQFNSFCADIDANMDDKRDGFKAQLETFFKREGWMTGGAYMNLAMEIENNEISSYEWDVESDGEYEDSYESYASYSFEYTPEEWQMSYEILVKLLESREYRLLLRSNMLAGPRAQVGTEYYLDIAHYTVTRTGQEAAVQIQFKVNADDPDERVELFRDLVEGDMDDEDNLRVVFNKTLAQIKEDNMSGSPWGGDVNESLVRNWKRFLA